MIAPRSRATTRANRSHALPSKERTTMKKQQPKTTTLHGMSGTGATLADAKRDAEQKIASLLDDMRKAPEVFAIGDWAIMLWRNPEGYSSRIIKQPDGWRSNNIYGGTCHSGDYETARFSVICHLAHLAWSVDAHDGELISMAVSLLPSSASRTNDVLRLTSELARYFQWQRRYAAARAQGKSDDEARDVASGR
jgi:hypothetical protein